jgi:hypothetical protein
MHRNGRRGCDVDCPDEAVWRLIRSMLVEKMVVSMVGIVADMATTVIGPIPNNRR